MKDTWCIDINCDVGEGVGNERELLPLISSCSIACGGHAGDEKTMRETVQLALRYKVRIGAHPSYPDKKNFGRLSMDIPPEDLIKSINGQLSTLSTILKEENAVLHHIKPHGALYNDLAKGEVLAKNFLKAVNHHKSSVALYVPYNSVIERLAINSGFKVKREAFADRNYDRNLRLVSRKLPHALLTDPKRVLKHLESMIKAGRVATIDGGFLSIQAETFCVHGDTPNALRILTYISRKLPQMNIEIVR